MQSQIRSHLAAIGITLLMMHLNFKIVKAEGVARINVSIHFERPLDTLYLMKTDGGCINMEPIAPTIKAVADGHMQYRFEIPVVNPGESFRLHRRVEDDTTELIFKVLAGRVIKYLPIAPQFYLSPDDDLHIQVKKVRFGAPLRGAFGDYTCTFSGRNSVRYAMQFRADSILNRDKPRGQLDEYLGYSKKDPHKSEALKMLESIRPQISDFYYRLIKTYILFFDVSAVFNALAGKANMDGRHSKDFGPVFDKMMTDYFPEDESGASPFSRRYIDFLTRRAGFKSKLSHDGPSPGDVPDGITTSLKAPVRDRVLVYYLLSNNFENPKPLYDKAFAIMEDKSCLAELEAATIRFSRTEKVEFSLSDTSGNQRNIRDFYGKWLFLDFWFTGCGGCAMYYSNIIKHLEKEFADDSGIGFVSISADRSKAKWMASVSKGMYSSPHTLNFYTNGEGAEHAALKKYGVYSYPTIMLIDPDGYMAAFNTPGLNAHTPEEVAQYIRGFMKQRGK